MGEHVTTDVYAVGFLSDLREARRSGNWRAKLRWFRRSWRRRSYWNGFLAEHEACPHNAGRGWTRHAACRRVERIHRRVVGTDA